jgi:hypothetical protein
MLHIINNEPAKINYLIMQSGRRVAIVSAADFRAVSLYVRKHNAGRFPGNVAIYRYTGPEKPTIIL